jgi:ArsR family transcriptional regulator
LRRDSGTVDAEHAFVARFLDGTHFAFFRNDVTTLTTITAATKALGHHGRLRILAMLQAGPLSVCQIAAVLDAPVSTVSGHLLELRHARLVGERRQGKWVYYRLTDVDALTAMLGPVLAAVEDDPEVRRDAAAAGALRGRSPAAVCEAAALNTRQGLAPGIDPSCTVTTAVPRDLD